MRSAIWPASLSLSWTCQGSIRSQTPANQASQIFAINRGKPVVLFLRALDTFARSRIDMDLPDDLVTVQRAAELVAADDSTIRRWIERGLIRGWRRRGLKTATLVSEAEVKAQASPVPIVPKHKPPDETKAESNRRQREAEAYLKSVGIA